MTSIPAALITFFALISSFAAPEQSAVPGSIPQQALGIQDRQLHIGRAGVAARRVVRDKLAKADVATRFQTLDEALGCLLYTSDAADE